MPFIAIARAACRVPHPGPVGPALERIDELLSAAEQMLSADGDEPRTALGLVMSAGVIAATEPLAAPAERVDV